MGRYTGKACRLLSMLALTAAFFLVEIIVGYVTNSIALVADSFHMLSDVIALIVGFASVRISRWKSPKNTFGWARAEVLGALVNAVFLITLCFCITIEALKRLVQVEKIDNPQLMLIVGGTGLFVNIIGLILFHNHGHSHGGGGHSHGGHGHGHGGKGHTHEHEDDTNHGREMEALLEDRNKANGNIVSEESSCVDIDETDITVEIEMDDPKVSSSTQLNMRGVFLHVLGDALGSVVVVISSLLIWFIEDDWKYYADPAMSLVMVVIIVSTTIPLLKESSFILLQTVPGHILVSDIKEKLVKIPGVMAIHELHVWQLAGNTMIASAHVQCHSMAEYTNTIAQKIKDILHHEGIHSSTIQPEIVDQQDPDCNCALECGPDKTCYQYTCCAERVKKSESNKNSPMRKNGSARNSPQREVTPSVEKQGADIICLDVKLITCEK